MLKRFAFFTAIIGAAFLFDIYFDDHPVELNQIENSSKEESATEKGIVYLFSSVNNSSVKTSVQKTPTRKLYEQKHNKNLQNYHQVRNYQLLKAESKLPKRPLIFSYHHLTFRHFFYTFPDDDPFIS